MGQARDGARETVLRRYAAGTLHPTWVALNWGISQGTVEDRVAIVEALADAAAAAVVADALDPDVADALALDAGQVVGMAAGSASEGALARALYRPADPELGRRQLPGRPGSPSRSPRWCLPWSASGSTRRSSPAPPRVLVSPRWLPSPAS